MSDPTMDDRATGDLHRGERVRPARIACAGCGWRLPDGDPVVLRCPAGAPGDDVDHVLVRHLVAPLVRFPEGRESRVFARYRTLLFAYHAWREAGGDDAGFVTLVERLDDAVAAVDGHGFHETPFGRNAALSDRLGFSTAGGVWVKDETGNVSGSHKARHLMGTMLELQVADAVRARRGGPGSDGAAPAPADGAAPEAAAAAAPPTTGPLAIASCGNAALAASVVARAARRDLHVYVTEDADPVVVARIQALGAHVEACPRRPGVTGDPSYHRLLAAVDAGAVPFTCQGNLNGLAIEGGETLGWEIVTSLLAASSGGAAAPAAGLDHLFVQVGGGALAASAIGAFLDARALGAEIAVPRLHAVQAEGVAPLARAYDLVLERIRREVGPHASDWPLDLTDSGVTRVLADVAHHRSASMWPWESEPHSIAGGILDDETYDWLAVVRGMLATGGSPLVVDETTLAEANDLARSATGIDVDHTGSSGLAGLMQAIDTGLVGPDDSVAVLFTGVRRSPAPPGPSMPPGPPSPPA